MNLRALQTPLNSQEEIEQVATISAQDATVGKLLLQRWNKLEKMVSSLWKKAELLALKSKLLRE